MVPKCQWHRKLFLRSLLILVRHKTREHQLVWGGKKKDETTTDQGGKVGHVLVVYICVLLQKSPPPRHCILLCLCATLHVCLLWKGQRMAVPKNPLILYHHIQSACLIGEDLGVEQVQTLLMQVCILQ